ncbi:hypothetical protein V8E54_000416 [Elaphomyces granulatus]
MKLRVKAFGNFIDEGGPISWLPNPSPAYANNVTKSPLEWLLDLILAILSQDMCYLSKHKPLDPEPRVTVRLALLVRSSSPVGGLGEGALCLPFLLQYFRSPRPSTTSLLRPSLVHYDLHLFPQAQYGVELSQTHWRGIPT